MTEVIAEEHLVFVAELMIQTGRGKILARIEREYAAIILKLINDVSVARRGSRIYRQDIS
jgi:hypothetical protein